MQTLEIGGVNLPNRYILAPMAGVCDLPFRLLCAEAGAGLTSMEMVSAKAIFFDNAKTYRMMKTGPKEHPVSLQLFGNEPALLGQMIRKIEHMPFDIIDFNMGCPVPKVVNNNEGSALLKDPILSGRIIEAMVKATKKPVTVKIRIGFDENHINAVEIARIAEKSGAAAITVHGRTREQYYEGNANWDEIAKVKQAVKIPVIGNGDIYSPGDAMDMLKKTGCDGVAIARGARGNPWIFKRLIEYEKTGIDSGMPNYAELSDMITRHARSLIEEKGEYIGMREMRKHAAWYVAGRPKASKMRGRLNEIESISELESLIETVLT